MNKTNDIIKRMVIIGDFLLLNTLLFTCHLLFPQWNIWQPENINTLYIAYNFSMIVGEYYFHTIIHKRLISAGDIFRRITLLVSLQTCIAFFCIKLVGGQISVVYTLIICIILLFFITISRFFERLCIKYYRKQGRNTRTIVFVGADKELMHIYNKLIPDPTIGYRLIGYYADFTEWTSSKQLGTISDLINNLDKSNQLVLGDEMFVCLPIKEREIIKRLSRFCEKNIIRFHYIPTFEDTLGIPLRKEILDDIVIYTTYDIPLNKSINKAIKRSFDIVFSSAFLCIIGLFSPIIALIIKIQSPGPIFFRQVRTGMNGKDFVCYKFRSMHINKMANCLQATKDDPRKFSFGKFMRKTSIDELPQFWNVLKGDMAIVGPRPHMLIHTEQYSKLIDKYMVRHFIKPGITGWAQVTGFRGETKELWQMKGRIERDIWYIENWSIWLDIRIIWLTMKSVLFNNENVY